ncbi:MAG: hypothetical protein Q7W05_14470 [Deltaproteobacteria bacterium]|nr:hypothetical protein [Deltaproteobacteria bacterium]
MNDREALSVAGIESKGALQGQPQLSRHEWSSVESGGDEPEGALLP